MNALFLTSLLALLAPSAPTHAARGDVLAANTPDGGSTPPPDDKKKKKKKKDRESGEEEFRPERATFTLIS